MLSGVLIAASCEFTDIQGTHVFWLLGQCPSLPDLQKILEEPGSTAKSKKKVSMGGSSDNEDFTVELDAISVVDSDED